MNIHKAPYTYITIAYQQSRIDDSHKILKGQSLKIKYVLPTKNHRVSI